MSDFNKDELRLDISTSYGGFTLKLIYEGEEIDTVWCDIDDIIKYMEQ